ncbi:MAG: HAMP domain-containing histidine kinase [Ruminiclostridium sp.]|nr:HAMP domain-containing histidine kinase [Ruminiclostridium sp.]
MKAWSNIFAVFAVMLGLIFIGANLLLISFNSSDSGRQYRVEINRAALQIEQNGFDSLDLSQYKYLDSVTEYGENFYNSNSDYLIKEISGKLYRFDYSIQNNGNRILITAAVNVILAAAGLAVFGLLLYIRQKILSPFNTLSDIPYRLSKGNLTAPVKESKNRYFGKFLWGIDLLRENIEQQKQRELELQKEKKTLLLSLSHDVKTPLSAIKLYSKALSKDLYTDREKQREIAESINQKADEIENYISQIITASREDFLSLEAEQGEFYLSDLVKSISEYYGEKLFLIKTEFTVGEYKNTLISGDLNRSIEVLQNVMENALKYGDGRKIELLFPDEDEGVLISVKNSGNTLARSELPHIFESFQRGENAKNIGGSGLGLYIARQLMHKMKGEIFAEIDNDAFTVTVVFGKA